MSDRLRELDALLRTEFEVFLGKAFHELNGGASLSDAPYLSAIAHRLDKVRQEGGARLIISLPPRYLKSITISVAWVAWMLGQDPSLSFVCVSYSLDLALKHARDCRTLMQTDWYRRIFPRTRLDREAEHDLKTTAGGGRYSTSTGGTLTGRGGSIIIIDDPIKPEDAMSEAARNAAIEWYGSTLYTRLDNKVTGSIILVMQRLHEADLAGRLLEKEDGGWDVLKLAAIAEEGESIPLTHGGVMRRKEGEALDPAREDVALLLRHKATLGSYAFAAQYQQSPTPAEGAMIKKDWLQWYDAPPQRQPGDLIVQSWDCASKTGLMNDYSVCITALCRQTTNCIYVLDVHRRKLEFPDLRRTAAQLARRWQADHMLIEEASSGFSLLQELRNNPPEGFFLRPVPIRPEANKLVRVAQACAHIEGRGLVLPREATWLALFQHEILTFPGSAHDDQTDALAQLINWYCNRQTTSIPVGPRIYQEGDSTSFDDYGAGAGQNPLYGAIYFGSSIDWGY